MANIPQARKRARQNPLRREHNAGLRSRARTYVKGVLKAIKKGDKPAARAAFKAAESMLASSVTKGVIHRNKAARYKSRLNAKIKAMSS